MFWCPERYERLWSALYPFDLPEYLTLAAVAVIWLLMIASPDLKGGEHSQNSLLKDSFMEAQK